ncbi:MAG: twin-arginine translocase TatA/TatE family subunit [bacterium]
MRGIGGPEWIIILVVVLIVFGAGKLPEVLRSMGQGVKAFKDEVGSGKDDGSDKKS